VSRRLSPSGPLSSPRYERLLEYSSCDRLLVENAQRTDWRTQALEGKDVKDLLVNVGSGGGAAAPAAGGAAAGGAAEEAKEEEKKEEGTFFAVCPQSINRTETNIRMQLLRSPTRTWASVSSTKRFTHAPTTTFSCFFVLQLHGFGVHIDSVDHTGWRRQHDDIYPAAMAACLVRVLSSSYELCELVSTKRSFSREDGEPVNKRLLNEKTRTWVPSIVV
jgi:hypothetical protein